MQTPCGGARRARVQRVPQVQPLPQAQVSPHWQSGRRLGLASPSRFWQPHPQPAPTQDPQLQGFAFLDI